MAALELELPLIAAVPFEDQDCKWRERDRQRYREILSKAAEVVYVCDPGYAAWKMQKRNEYLVERADVMLALWNGTSGGTANCLRYAESKGVQVVNVWKSWVKYA